MPTVTQVGNSSNSYTSSSSELDEFLPLVEIKADKIYRREKDGTTSFKIDGDILLETSKRVVTLSEKLNLKKRILSTLTTEKRELTLRFYVKKGKDIDSWFDQDNDGFIEAKSSNKRVTVKKIRVRVKKATEANQNKYTSGNKILTKFNDVIELVLVIKGKESEEFYLNFHANDDEETFIAEGEYENIHCGRMKISFENFKFKKVYYAISLMKETDYRSDNFKFYKNFIKVKNKALSPSGLGNFLAKQSEGFAKNNNDFDGEEIHFLAIFSHGVINNIFGDPNSRINKSEITTIFSSKSIHFSKDAVIFLGACNAGTRGARSFAQKLADVTEAKVIGMVDDGVAVVSETTGNSNSPKMIYGPKYGNKYNGKFYEFKKGTSPLLISKEIDIINLIDKQKINE